MPLPAKLPRSIAKLLEQLTHSGDGVFAVDSQQRIVAWNKAAESLLGYSAKEVLGKYCCEIIQGRDSNGVLQCVAHCSHFEQGKSLRWARHMELQSRSKSGQNVWISIATVSIVSPRRELSVLVHIFRQADRPDPAASSLVSLQPASPGQRMAGREHGSAAAVPLSDREMAVLRLLAEGHSTKGIAAQLFLSPVTVRNHIQNILKKLDVHTRLEAILWALRHRDWPAFLASITAPEARQILAHL